MALFQSKLSAVVVVVVDVGAMVVVALLLAVLPPADGLTAKALAGGSGGVPGSEPVSSEITVTSAPPFGIPTFAAVADGGGWVASLLTACAMPGRKVSFDWRSFVVVLVVFFFLPSATGALSGTVDGAEDAAATVEIGAEAGTGRS